MGFGRARLFLLVQMVPPRPHCHALSSLITPYRGTLLSKARCHLCLWNGMGAKGGKTAKSTGRGKSVQQAQRIKQEPGKCNGRSLHVLYWRDRKTSPGLFTSWLTDLSPDGPHPGPMLISPLVLPEESPERRGRWETKGSMKKGDPDANWCEDEERARQFMYCCLCCCY